MPKISVIMPLYNSEDYVEQAIHSVLSQTMRDFELLVLDDGSEDKSIEIVQKFSDKRIRVVIHAENMGAAKARNTLLEIATGKYIALMDSDDLSLPQRFAKQVRLLDSQPQAGGCGAWIQILGRRPHALWRYPADPDAVRACMLFGSPLAAPTVMVRTSILAQPHLQFDSRFEPAEDYDLWERIARTYNLYNITEVLALYRIHSSQLSQRKRKKQQDCSWKVQLRQLQQLGINPTEMEKSLHWGLGLQVPAAVDTKYIQATEQWLSKLANANDQLNIFSPKSFNQEISRRWFRACRTSVQQGHTSWTQYGQSLLSSWEPVRWRRKGRLFLDWLLPHKRIRH